MNEISASDNRAPRHIDAGSSAARGSDEDADGTFAERPPLVAAGAAGGITAVVPAATAIA